MTTWDNHKDVHFQPNRSSTKTIQMLSKYYLNWLKCVRVLSWAQSCLTLCEPMDCSLPGSSVHGDSPGKNTGVGCHALLQGFFPTQGSNPGLPHCRQILYHLSHQGSPLTKRQGERNELCCHLVSKLPAPVPAGVGAWKWPGDRLPGHGVAPQISTWLSSDPRMSHAFLAGWR